MSSNVSENSSTEIDFIQQHALLHRSTSYMAHRSFLASTTWDTDHEDRTKRLFTGDGLSPYTCIMSGRISKHNFHLSLMGDCELVGNPPQLSIPYYDSFLRFSLEEPIDPSQALFRQDFKKFIKVVHDAIDAIPGDGEKGRVSPFLTRSEDGQWRFNFGFKIFAEEDYRPEFYYRTDPLKLTNYPIPPPYDSLVDDWDGFYYPRRLPLWHYTGVTIDPDDYIPEMKDALVKVSIKLNHDKTTGLNAEVQRITIIGP